MPEPETPVTHTSPPSGTFTLIDFKLFSFAPITSKHSFVFTFRRFVVNPALRACYAVWRLRGKGLGFTEFRYAKAEMDRFLTNTNFEIVRVVPDDYFLPWSKGLFVDLCDVGSFFHFEHKPPYEFGRFGTAVVAAIQRFGIWRSCEGIFYVTRAKK